MSLGKLIKEIRAINVYPKTKSKFLPDALEEFDISHISLDVLVSIVQPNNDDPHLLNGYTLDSKELDKLNNLINNEIVSDHKKFDYALECYGVYEKQ
jgi:hypothetical protein